MEFLLFKTRLRDSLKISTIFLHFFSLLFTYCYLFIYCHWDLMFRNFCIIVFLIEEIFWKEKEIILPIYHREWWYTSNPPDKIRSIK